MVFAHWYFCCFYYDGSWHVLRGWHSEGFVLGVGQRESKAVFGHVLQGLGLSCPFSQGKGSGDFNAVLKRKSEQMEL